MREMIQRGARYRSAARSTSLVRTSSRPLRAARPIALAVGLAAFIALSPATAAQAAPGVELSDDGASYGPALPGPLFAGSPVLVPMGSASEVFWVRNGSAVDAYLRVTLENPSWSSAQYGSAISVTASAPSRSGSWAALTSASDCEILLHGVLLAPGQAVAVTTTIAMGDVPGSVGQSSWAALDLGVALTESAGLPEPVDCSAPATPVVVVPASGGGGAAAPEAAEEEPTAEEPETAPEPEPEGFIAVLANTLTDFDSSLLAVASSSVPAGAALFFLVGFGRRVLERLRGEVEP